MKKNEERKEETKKCVKEEILQREDRGLMGVV